MSLASIVVERSKYYGSLLSADLLRGYLTHPRKSPVPGVDPLAAAMAWICAAQDATDDGGVARSFAFAYQPYFKRKGWMASYPETTGYIIPTMFDYAQRSGRAEFFERAVRMADWECAVQMPNGAVQGGTIDASPTPAVFNTGQVLFGWIRAFQETGNDRYLHAAIRAGDYLVAAQDADGAWRKSLSNFAMSEQPHHTYNTRTAWGLLLLGESTGKDAYRNAAVRNIEFAMTERRSSGWFDNNCLYDRVRPLLHTIAYSLRGMLEVGIATNNATFINAARKGADALLARQRDDGSLPARFDEHWRPAATYSCVTGNSQMGTVWARLHDVTADPRYLEGLRRANAFVRSVQWLGTGNPGLDGGISGSHPFHGAYGRFEVLNWAVKFFADSLMFEADAAAGAARGTPMRAVMPATQ
jgi:hypothetical protein